MDDWGWAIGSGTYVSDLEDKIFRERVYLNEKNQEQISNIIMVNVAVFIVLFFKCKIVATVYL